MNNEFEEALKEYNSRIVSEEEIQQQLLEQEEFGKEMSHLIGKELSEDDLSHFDKRTKNKVLHLQLLEKQDRELINLQNNGASQIEVHKLRAKHAKQEDELLSKQFSYKKITEDDVKAIQAKKFLSPKELSIKYPRMSLSSQATFRGRLKDKLPYYQATKRGKITYVIEEVELWMDNNNIR